MRGEAGVACAACGEQNREGRRRDGLAKAMTGYAAVGAYGHAARLAGELGGR